MFYLYKTLSKRNVFSVENVAKRMWHGERNRRKIKERSNLIKVAVVGSGSHGDPASLIVKTCDNFVYAII